MKPCAKSQNAGKRHNLLPGTFQTIFDFPRYGEEVSRWPEVKSCLSFIPILLEQILHRGQSGSQVESKASTHLQHSLMFKVYTLYNQFVT